MWESKNQGGQALPTGGHRSCAASPQGQPQAAAQEAGFLPLLGTLLRRQGQAQQRRAAAPPQTKGQLTQHVGNMAGKARGEEETSPSTPAHNPQTERCRPSHRSPPVCRCGPGWTHAVCCQDPCMLPSTGKVVGAGAGIVPLHHPLSLAQDRTPLLGTECISNMVTQLGIPEIRARTLTPGLLLFVPCVVL